ncbi:TonB-dependent receptor [Altererythrobacter sp. C41]|uniref:TonB-dependent receptor n=1 Tax=Altererythrobacter sp. C41 TaxID=2806021 RepID=UPI00193345A7|nr:TonB-dependent receptor [Altererythrobacter sp. C41]MBM0168457.1 TonB-dependent receptor [Altererythrobacter sp. C41]
MQKIAFTTGAAALAVAAGLVPSVAQAQEAVDSPPQAPAEAAGDAAPMGDAIIVTARRRSETLTDVPIAIEAVSAETIQNKGIATVDSVAQITPGLQFDKGASPADVRPSLRGISLIEGRSNVAMIVDGIDVTGVSLNTTIGGSGSQTAAALMDLERIEVVKGPQTVYFGRSAFAGAIQFISKDPEFVTGGTVSGAIGDYGRRELTAHITGPVIGDVVAAKLSATYRNFGGFYENPGNQQGLGASEVWGVGGSALVESGAFRGKFSINYLDEHITPGAAYVIERPDISVDGVNVIDEDMFDPSLIGISSHMEYKGNVSETWRGIANMSLDLGGGLSLASVTGINKVDSTIQFDFDTKRDNVPSLTPVGGGLYNCLPGVCVGIAEFDTSLQQLSQELRLSYDSDDLRLLFGGYVFDENYEELDYTRFLGSQDFVTETRTGIAPRPSRLNTNTYSLFGSVDADVAPGLTLTGELRFNHEIIRAEAATGFNILFQNGPADITFRGKETFNSWLPRVNAKLELTDDVNLYGSIAKGSKPGGFNVGQVRNDLRPFGQETVWTYEIGTKGRIAGGLISFDAALYYSDWRDVQVTTICYGTASPFGPEAECPDATAVSLNYIVNADKAEVKGAELGLVVRPADPLTLTFNYAYADSTFVDFEARDVYPAPAGTDRQFGGNRLPLVPKHSLSGSVRVEEPIADGVSLFTELSARYRSSRYARFDNRVLLAGKTVADAQIGLKGDDWTALIFVDNIFNELTPDFARYYGNFGPSRPNGEFIAAPAKRSFGLRVSKEF